jgi:hypothetical protein
MGKAKWTSSPPTEPGWYWRKITSREESEWGAELVSYFVAPALIKKYVDLQVTHWGQPYSTSLAVDKDVEWWPVPIEAPDTGYASCVRSTSGKEKNDAQQGQRRNNADSRSNG